MRQLPLPISLSADMQQIERIVLERINSQPAVASVAGSRFARPEHGRTLAALVLLVAGLGQYNPARVIHAAAAVELISAAARTHDDLVDEAQRRRAGGSYLEPWPHGIELMVGDYLFALAAGEMALAPDPRVIDYYSQAVMEISERTLTPLQIVTPLERAIEQHRFARGDKRAALPAAAARAGMACGGGQPEQIECLGRSGYALGLAIQLHDELRIAAHDQTAGLRNGQISFPLICAAAHEDPARLAAALDGDDPDELAWAAEMVRRHGLAPAHSAADRFAAEARSGLTAFPAGEAREALESFYTFVLEYGW